MFKLKDGLPTITIKEIIPNKLRLVELNPRVRMEDDKGISQSLHGGELKQFQVGDSADKCTWIAANSKNEYSKIRERLEELSLENIELFAFMATDMTSFDPNFCCHKLTIHTKYKSIVKKK